MVAPKLEDAVNVSALESECFGDAGIDDLPSTTFKPSLSALSFRHASFQPRFASLMAYGSVALVSARVDVRGTAPGMFVTQ